MAVILKFACMTASYFKMLQSFYFFFRGIEKAINLLSKSTLEILPSFTL